MNTRPISLPMSMPWLDIILLGVIITIGLMLPPPAQYVVALLCVVVVGAASAVFGYWLDQAAFPVFSPANFVSQKRYWWATLACLRRIALMLSLFVCALSSLGWLP